MAGKRKRAAKDGPNMETGAKKRAKGDSKPSKPPASTKPNLEKIPFVEMPTGEDRRREAALYELLGSDDEGERIEAADCIVSSLLGGDGVPEPVLQRHLDRRLFRGLASGRNFSRLGFSLVLTEILGQLFGADGNLQTRYSGLTFDKVLGLLVDKTQAVGNIPGQEERDHYFGQLFGIECFVRSKTLFNDTSRWNAILGLLLQLGNKKIWLRSQCGWVLVQAMEQMSKEEVEGTLVKVVESGLAKTPEGVAAWLVAQSRYPDLKLKPWGNPLSSKSLGDLAAVLKESFKDQGKDSNDKAQNGGKQAHWTAQLHFVWDLILGYYIKGGAEAGVDGLSQFWNRVVDDGLFSKNATDGQKFKGFMVFQKMLEGLVDQHAKLQCLFSKNFVTCLMNQAAKEDRYLHRAATKALKAIEHVVSAHPQALAPILQCLLEKNGTYSFDQRTNTKTIDRLLQNTNQQNADGALAVIRSPIASLKQQGDIEAQAFLRVYADYLAKVLNAFASEAPAESSSTVKNRGSSFGPILQELSGLAYSKPKDVPESALTEQIRELCRARIESSLAKLTRNAEDYSTFCNAVASIDPASKNMTEEIKTAMNDALSRMSKLLKRKSKGNDDKSLTQGLAMLHAISIFQLYNEDPDAMEVLNDLSQFYDRLKTGKVSDESEGSSELLVEILLSMVARPSSLMRQVSQQVFDAFTGQISAEGLELLTGPLSSSESTKGQKELFNTEDDEMGIDESGSSDDDDVEEVSDVEIDSDVEFVDINGEDGQGSEDEDGDEGDEDEDEDEDDEEEETGDSKKQEQDLDELVGKILNSHRLDKDDDAEESASDGDMSDSEMLALDDKLAEVFKQRTIARPDSKKQKKDARQSVVNFKHRILDLLDTYVKNEALSPLAFSLLVPLLNLMRTTSTKALANRACEIILTYQRGLKKARASNQEEAEAPDADGLLALLVEVHDEAGKDNAHAYAKAASAASLIVASAMFAADREAIKQVAAVYAKTQSGWVLGEARLQNSFFADWNNWCQNHASSQARA